MRKLGAADLGVDSFRETPSSGGNSPIVLLRAQLSEDAAWTDTGINLSSEFFFSSAFLARFT
jgi:hypothetical protein